MDRNYGIESNEPTDGSAPSEAWLFAQALLGNPIPQIISPETKARAEREKLQRLALFSTRHAEELLKVEAAEAKARHDRELLTWAAQISTRAEEKLRALQRKEAVERETWRSAEQFAEHLMEGTSATHECPPIQCWAWTALFLRDHRMGSESAARQYRALDFDRRRRPAGRNNSTQSASRRT